MEILEFLLVGGAAAAAGLVNALAGGGTLISFPVLMFVGLPALSANVTNTVALVPGYLGATMAQRADLQGQGRRLRMLLPVGAVGGILGGLLLLNTGERLFRELVPYLILLASSLLAVQEPLRRRLSAHQPEKRPAPGAAEGWTALPVGLASIYGGYFGAGLSVIILAALGLTLDDTLTRLNALKQSISFSVNIAAACYFLFSGQVVWSIAVLMAVCALAGGALGGRLASRVKASTLRKIVVLIGFSVAVLYFVRN